MVSHLKDEQIQKESGRRLFLLASLGVVVAGSPGLSARADGELDAGGLTFKDFGTADNGASFSRNDPVQAGRPEPTAARLVAIDTANGLARVYFETVKVEASLPLGWQATEDSERGVGLSADHATRVLIWRVDFAFEGVRDADHYVATKAGAIEIPYARHSRRGPKIARRHVPDCL